MTELVLRLQYNYLCKLIDRIYKIIPLKEENIETYGSRLGDNCSDPRSDNMYGVRYLSPGGRYGPDKGRKYMYGVYRSWLRIRTL